MQRIFGAKTTPGFERMYALSTIQEPSVCKEKTLDELDKIIGEYLYTDRIEFYRALKNIEDEITAINNQPSQSGLLKIKKEEISAYITKHFGNGILNPNPSKPA